MSQLPRSEIVKGLLQLESQHLTHLAWRESVKLVNFYPTEKFLFPYFNTKELSFCHNLKFSNFYISATSGYKPLIFQT